MASADGIPTNKPQEWTSKQIIAAMRQVVPPGPSGDTWLNSVSLRALEPFPSDGVKALKTSDSIPARTFRLDGRPAPRTLHLPFLLTTPDRFATVLEDITRLWGEYLLRYEDGTTIRSARFFGFRRGKPHDGCADWNKGNFGTIQWIAGEARVGIEDGREVTSGTGVWMAPLVTVNCLETGNDRDQQISVRIECFDSWVWRYFWTFYVEMLMRIADKWGHTRQKIDEHLRACGEGSTTAESEQAPVESASPTRPVPPDCSVASTLDIVVHPPIELKKAICEMLKSSRGADETAFQMRDIIFHFSGGRDALYNCLHKCGIRGKGSKGKLLPLVERLRIERDEERDMARQEANK